ncbi:MAG: serine/threonine protein kinase [Chitinophagaceae bacterium]|nr:MAG: serine/threonine protein kinase [Chitinophagaceae bacterium]
MYRETSGVTEVAGYVLSDRLGSGGMGDVYKAYHPGLQRYAAVKILHQKEMGERFRNEAFIQSSVNHPNIARLYESNLTGPTPSIVMEYVEGESLDRYIRRHGKVGSEAAAKILLQVTTALTYLHAKDILHRDIKPSNFKIQQDGTVKMLDFGIAKHKFSPRLTQQGFIVGTTEYMAPEQFRQQVEKQSDIWSLGVMLYEMLTGHLPFEAVNPLVLQGKILRASFTDPQILVSTISPVLNTVIEKSLRVNPANRITASAIKKLLAGEVAATGTKTPAMRIRAMRIPGMKMPAFTTAALKRSPLVVSAVIGLAILIMMVLINIDPVNEPGPTGGGEVSSSGQGEPVRQVVATGEVYRVRINTPGVNNASAVFASGESKRLPAEVSGREGDRIEFLIRADGYEDKKVSLGINSRRGAFDYNLEKIK